MTLVSKDTTHLDEEVRQTLLQGREEGVGVHPVDPLRNQAIAAGLEAAESSPLKVTLTTTLTTTSMIETRWRTR